MHKLIGSGVDGKVYETRRSHICRKVVVLKNTNPLYHQFEQIQNNIVYCFTNPAKTTHIVELASTLNDLIINENYISYNYKMVILNKISEDEAKLFHTIISHEDSNLNKDISKSNVIKKLDELSAWLTFNYENVLKFTEQIRTNRVKHLDIHPRNIMKDDWGGFRFIDLERLFIT